jgi:hypothetical protein
MQPGPAEDGLEPNTGSCYSALPAGPTQRSTQLWTGQTGGLSWSRRDSQDRTHIWMCQTTGPAVFERLQKRRVVLAQQGAELVGDLLAVPDGILLSARQHGNSLSQLRVGW